MREYFVSYFFQKGTSSGYGQMTVRRTCLIRNAEDLEGVRQYIRRYNKFKQVTIIGWQRYEEPVALIGGAK